MHHGPELLFLRNNLPMIMGRGSRPSWAAGAGLWRDFRRSAAGVTDTHADTIYADDAAGAWAGFAPNTLVRTSRGLQTSPTRTNGIRNNSMMGAVAGSPGTLPTNWISGNSNGLTREIVGTGVAGGLPYVDIRYAGVTTGGTFINIGFETTTGAPVANGQTLTQSGVLSIVAGSLANTSLRWRTSLYTAAPTYLAEASSQTLSLTTSPQRVAQTFTVNNASAERLFPYLQIGYAGTGAAIDITLRIAAPQLELGAFASPPIITAGAAATVAGNQQVIAGIPAPATEAGLAVINLRGSADTNVLWSRNDGTASEWIGLIRDGADLDFRVIDGGATVADLNLGTLPVGKFGFAYTVGAGYARAEIVSGATVAALAPASFPTVTQWAAGDGYSAARNAFENIERMAQAAGVTANDATFAAWLSRAVLALAA